jgi:hypothetical protein
MFHELSNDSSLSERWEPTPASPHHRPGRFAGYHPNRGLGAAAGVPYGIHTNPI